jgi:hypothetical protein
MIKTMSVKINKLFKIQGHCKETHMKATTSAYGVNEFGKTEAYESYNIIKSKQKKKNRFNNISGERLYIFIRVCGVKSGSVILKESQ